MSSKIIFPVALVLIGAGLFGLSQNYLDNQKSNEVTVAEAVVEETPENTVLVWVATESVEKKAQLSPELFELKAVPEQDAISRGVDPSEPFTIRDTWIAKNSIESDSWLSINDFVTPESEDYLDYALSENMVPYPMVVKASTIIGGSIRNGSEVDVIAITQQKVSEGAYRVASIDIQPILAAKTVLKVESNDGIISSNDNVTVILELARNEVAMLTIAKSVATLELHRSAGVEQAALLNANSGDVLPQFKAIAEYRGDALSIR